MKYDVITIGTATRDIFLKSKDFKILKDANHLKAVGIPGGEAECLALGSKIDIENPVLTTGGGATNAAVTFARQGYKTACIASLGNDSGAADIIGDLTAEGITPIISRSKKHGSGYSTLLLTTTGERTVLVYRGAANDLQDKELALSSLRAKWVYITPSGISLPVILRLVKHFKKNGSKIAMNPSGFYLALGAKKLQPLLKMLDVVTMNREEAALLTEQPIEDERAIFQALDKLIDGVVAMTEGPQGSLVASSDVILQAGILKEKIMADRTGAGDAYGSGFVAGLLASASEGEESLRLGMRLGSANSTAVVEHLGAKKGILTKEQFQKDRRWKKLKITKINK